MSTLSLTSLKYIMKEGSDLITDDNHWKYASDIFNNFIKYKFIKKNYGSRPYIAINSDINNLYIYSIFYNKNIKHIYQCFIFSNLLKVDVHEKIYNRDAGTYYIIYRYIKYIKEINNNQIDNFIKADSIRQYLV